MVVHPAAGNATGTLVNALIAHCGDSLSGIGGVRRPGIVHRLDKDTTGVMVVAKTDRAHAKLAAQFADHGRTGPLERGYLAFVWGAPDRPRGTIEQPIDRHPHARDKMAVRQGGREAITHWEVLERFLGPDGKPVASLLACRLETGRTHQIRVHLAHAGHPLIGDSVYGPGFRTKVARLSPKAAESVEALGRQALHAYLLAIEHPITSPTSGVSLGTTGRSRSFTCMPQYPGRSFGTQDGAKRARQIKDLTRARAGHADVTPVCLPFAPFNPVCCTCDRNRGCTLVPVARERRHRSRPPIIRGHLVRRALSWPVLLLCRS